jgi:hypothetical protein
MPKLERIIMVFVAKHLTPMTFELAEKFPLCIDSIVNMKV